MKKQDKMEKVDLNTEFRMIISHRMLGYDCNMSKHDFDGMLDDCVIIAKREFENKIKQLEEKMRIYDIQIWAAMKAQSLGLCKKCLSHAIRDLKALESEERKIKQFIK